MTYGGQGSYHYWGYETSYKTGDPSSDQNIPFNEPEKFVPPKPKYSHVRRNVYSSKAPYTIYSNALEPGEGSPTPMVWHDPFLLLAFFTHRVVGGTWGSGNTGTLQGDFSDIDDEKSIWIQYHIQDQESTNHENKLLKGVNMSSYIWIMRRGDLLLEDVTYRAATRVNNTQVMSLSNNFHDQEFGSGIGGFANWDDSGLSDSGRRSVADIVIERAGGALSGLDIQEATMTIEHVQNSKQTMDSLEQTKRWSGVYDFTFEITAALKDLTELTESEKKYSDQTLQTLKISIDTTVGEEKYIEVTNTYYEEMNLEIPAANDIIETTLRIKAGAGSTIKFFGKFKDVVDPSILVPTTP